MDEEPVGSTRYGKGAGTAIMKLPLHENERVVVKTRAHPRVLRQPFVMLLLLTAAGAFALGYLSREDLPDWLAPNTGVLSWLSLLLWFLLVMIWCAAPLVRWARGWIVLTTQRLIYRSVRQPGSLQSVGLYSVRDLVAHVPRKPASGRPGTLDVLLHNGYVRITNVPAVSSFRELAIAVMQDLGGSRQLMNHDGHATGEGNHG